jgi:Xaa-Pro aminopeptidase
MTTSSTRVHAARRARLLERISHEVDGSDGIVVVRGSGAGGLNPNFFYLTGIEEPAAALLLAPAGVRFGTGRANPGPGYVHGRIARQLLVLPATDPLAASWGEQGSATAENADAQALGVDAVLPAAQLDALLSAALPGCGSLHFVRSAPPALAGADDDDTAWASRVRRRFLNLRVRDASPIVHEMRRAKDDDEVAAIERAGAVTEEALEALLRLLAASRPGLRENELEAEIARVYRANGATHAFEPIVACGENALVLHYTSNSAPVADGRLLLVDTGARLAGYCADVTRTYPVGGRFDDAQRAVYQAVLDAQEKVIEACRPGALLGDLHALAWKSIDAAGYGEHFVHGLGHHLGIETHDVGDVHRPLEPGAVITVEPGIYVKASGIGVRIEDDVLITADGRRVLTEQIPKSVDAIERLLGGR